LVSGVLLFASLGIYVPEDVLGEWTGIALLTASFVAVAAAYRVTSVSAVAGYVCTLLAGALLVAAITIGIFHGAGHVATGTAVLLLGGASAFYTYAVYMFVFRPTSSFVTALQRTKVDQATWKDAAAVVLALLLVNPLSRFATYIANAPG
jgi:hypothetical protein